MRGLEVPTLWSHRWFPAPSPGHPGPINNLLAIGTKDAPTPRKFQGTQKLCWSWSQRPDVTTRPLNVPIFKSFSQELGTPTKFLQEHTPPFPRRSTTELQTGVSQARLIHVKRGHSKDPGGSSPCHTGTDLEPSSPASSGTWDHDYSSLPP